MAKSAFTFVKTAAGSAANPLAALAQTAGLFNDSQLKKGSKSFGNAKDQYLPSLGFTRHNGHWFNPDGTRASYEQKVAALKTVGTPNGPSAGTPGFPGAGGAVNHTPLNFNVGALPQSGFVPGTRAQDWLAQAFSRPYMEGWGAPTGTTPSAPPTAGGGNGGAGAGNGNPATGPVGTGGVPTGGGGGGTGLGGNLGGSTGQGGFPIGSGGVPTGGVGTGWGSGTGTFGGGSTGTPSGSGSGSVFGSLLGMAGGGGSISGSVLQALANAGVGWAQNLLTVGNGSTNPTTGFGTFSGQPMTDPGTAQIAGWNPTGGPTSGGWLQGSNPVSWAPTPGTGNYDVNPQADLSAVDALGTPRLGQGGGGSGGVVSGGGWGAGSNSANTFGNNSYVQNATNIGSLLSWLGGGAGGGSVFNYAVK